MVKLRNCHSPAGMSFYADVKHTHEVDCLKCRYGTLLKRDENKWCCIDCQQQYTGTLLAKLGLIPSLEKVKP